MAAPKKPQLGLVDLENPPANGLHVGSLPTPSALPVATRVSEVFVVGGFFVERRERRLQDGRRMGVYQFEMPLAGVRWVLDTIEEQFEKKPSEGGLPRAVFHVDATLAGEQLELRYGASVAGEGVGGYTVTNFSRAYYILPESSQQLSFSIDDWRKTVRDLFRSIARRYEAGELGRA